MLCGQALTHSCGNGRGAIKRWHVAINSKPMYNLRFQAERSCVHVVRLAPQRMLDRRRSSLFVNSCQGIATVSGLRYFGSYVTAAGASRVEPNMEPPEFSVCSLNHGSKQNAVFFYVSFDQLHSLDTNIHKTALLQHTNPNPGDGSIQLTGRVALPKLLPTHGTGVGLLPN